MNRTIHEKIGSELQSFGGYLECSKCKKKKPLGNVSVRLRDGWPECCGYTMTWITRKQLQKKN